LDGDRDSERRKDLTADVTSTWRTCVGDGKVSVPPPLLEYDIVRNAERYSVDMRYGRTSGLDLARADYCPQLIETSKRGRCRIDVGLTSKVDVKSLLVVWIVVRCRFVDDKASCYKSQMSWFGSAGDQSSTTQIS
jgi:hypothetical protein